MTKRLIAAGAAVSLIVPTSASAYLPWLGIGHARYELERRFQHEEQSTSGQDELLNCWRVSSIQVNCFSAEHYTASYCEVWLWRVWETANQWQRQHGRYTI